MGEYIRNQSVTLSVICLVFAINKRVIYARSMDTDISVVKAVVGGDRGSVEQGQRGRKWGISVITSTIKTRVILSLCMV